jgi:hypothetical protein
VALRLALPIAVAPLLAARLSRELDARVRIGDLSFQPLDAILTLRDVSVQPRAPADAAPAIAAARVRVDLQWLPLIHRMLRVRELRLESGHIHLDRFADGRFGLAELERTDPAAALPKDWQFALDRIRLRDTRLEVRDVAAGGSPLQAAVERADISGLRRRPTAFGKSNNLRLDALVGGGQLRVRGRYELRDDGVLLDALMRVKGVPLAQAAPYVGELGWRELSGEASGRLRWQREPGRRDLLSGQLAVRRAGVQVAGLPEPALQIRGALAEIAAIDLLARRIAIRSLTLHGAALALRADAAAPVPLLASAARPPSPGGRAARTAATAPAARWSWLIERFAAAGTRLRVLAADDTIELRANAAGENIGPGAPWSPLRVNVAHGPATAALDGTVRITKGVVVEGRLTAAGIDFAAVAHAAGLPWAELVRAGSVSADLTVQLDTAAGDAPFYARGAVGLTDVSLTAPDPGGFAVGAARADLTLEELLLRAPDGGGARGRRATRIRFSDALLAEPSVLLMRIPGEWILPVLDAAAPDDSPEIMLDAVQLENGRLTIVDLEPSRVVLWMIGGVAGAAQGVSLDAFRLDHLALQGTDPTFGGLFLEGSRRGPTSHFEVAGLDLPLAATAPYLELAGLPYSFATGRGSFIARGAVGPSQWSADTALMLNGPVLVGSDEALQRTIGMSVPDAMAQLRDPSGAVSVQVALAGARGDENNQADRVALGVRDSLGRAREAAAHAAALRAVAAIAPVNLEFTPGQADLTPGAMRALAGVAELASSRPGLAVEITTASSLRDRRRLAEQALAGTLEPSGGFGSVLRAIGINSPRDRIRAALAARASGAPGPLDPDDEAELTRMIAAAPPVDDARLAALRDARLTAVLDHLTRAYGLAAPRVALRDAGALETAIAPVRVRVMVAPTPPVVPAGAPPPQAVNAPPAAPLPVGRE